MVVYVLIAIIEVEVVIIIIIIIITTIIIIIFPVMIPRTSHSSFIPISFCFNPRNLYY